MNNKHAARATPQQLQQEARKEFETICCKSGPVGLCTNDLSDSAGFYNIYKCGFCGRKWHIYEQAPICQKYRKQYPDEYSFQNHLIEKAFAAGKEEAVEHLRTWWWKTCEETGGEIGQVDFDDELDEVLKARTNKSLD